MRWLRRWWARITHKHDWVVIYRCEVKVKDFSVSFFTEKQPAVLERCHCGIERCRAWNGQKWRVVDLEWFNFQLSKRNIQIPARHQE